MQVSTVAGWSRIFYRAADNTNISSLVYFFGIVLFVAYILNNLFLAGIVPLHSALLERIQVILQRMPMLSIPMNRHMVNSTEVYACRT